MSSDEQEFDDKEENDNDDDENGEANGSAHQDDDDDDDDHAEAITDSGRKRRASAQKKAPSYKEDEEDDGEEDDDDDDSSEDDDVPLSALAKPSKSPTKAKAKPTAKKKAAPAKKAKTKTASTKKATVTKAATTSTPSSGSSKSYEWASAALYGTGCDKGLLIQRLLCRWWYAYEWPILTAKMPAAAAVTTFTPDVVASSNGTPPGRPTHVEMNHYDALDGFPGVYICTSSEGNVGHILDQRDPATAPTFANFCRKSSDDLKQLLIVALEEQKKQLVETDGPGTVTETELNELLKWAKKVNTSKADKEAATVLKAHRLSVP